MMRQFILSGIIFLSTVNAFSQDSTTSTTNNSATVTTITDTARISVATSSTQDSRVIANATSSGQVYKLKKGLDWTIALAGSAWTLYGFSKIYNKPGVSEEQIRGLETSSIGGFDRWAADVYSENAAKTSDMFFYGSMPLPLLLLLDKKIRRDAGKVSLMYLEAMAVTGTIYTSSSMLFDRFRPYTYNPDVDMDFKMRGGSRNSFFAGHVALVGTSTFFMAKVLSDYHPESKAKWAYYTVAAAATGMTGYLRHKGGRHFPSDILLGAAVGTFSGIMIPNFHKNKIFKDPNITVLPFTGESHGLAFIYKFNKKRG